MPDVAVPPQAQLENGQRAGSGGAVTPRSSRPGGAGGGARVNDPESIVPTGHEDRVYKNADGSIKIEASNNANLGTTYGTLTELNNMINSGNAALLANKDNEANISSIQIQLQRLQKILGIIEQNIAGKLQFGFGIIKMYDGVFQRPQLQG